MLKWKSKGVSAYYVVWDKHMENVHHQSNEMQDNRNFLLVRVLICSSSVGFALALYSVCWFLKTVVASRPEAVGADYKSIPAVVWLSLFVVIALAVCGMVGCFLSNSRLMPRLVPISIAVQITGLVLWLSIYGTATRILLWKPYNVYLKALPPIGSGGS
jgi:hypothetical protein